MKTIRFETDRRLWFWIALVLFAISWFIPVVEIKGPYFSMARGLKGLIHAVQQDSDSEAQLMSRVLTVFALVSVLLSIVFGWLLHCFVIIIRGRKHER